ncbi:hypothetical protein [Aurantiacibacter spongiae]|uniref:SxtJ n=1 Tax=Aurantiacibacter spongiae TaxID=2488860 RepID=A0A3N5CSP1_9SPHN|nr:hypothetical protein [Aurantiacibacter spongiae]RPF72173.1 hypothetical protein EG799_11490 [Aurantiacibacter spongiae]
MAGTGHETYEDHREIAGPSDRSFGLTVGGILVAIGLVRRLFLSAGPGSTLALLIVGGLLVLAALTRPALLAPLNTAWTKLGLLLAAIVNPVMMALIYTFVFLPVGLGMKLFGRDALNRRRAPGSRTQWISRDPAGPPPDTMKNQF